MKAMIWNKHWWIETTEELALSTLLQRYLEQAGFTVLNTIEHAFEPMGYTRLWLLAESHLALHTFPEEGKAYIELSSCNGAMQKKFEVLMERDDASVES